LQNLTALSIARERELGTLEQLVMTPIRPVELLFGKLAPFGIVGLLDATVVGLIVVYGFGVPFRGSVVVLSAATFVFLFAVLGLGLVVSTLSSNQQQAQLTNFFLTFPAILITGFIFPVQNLPLVLQWLSNVVPMTHYLAIVRGVYLRGSGWEPLWPRVVWLVGLAVVYFGLGALRFRKRLE
jgi:ABC-2 type transport system permease protein